MGKPSLAGGATADAVFQGLDFKHYNANFNGAWGAVGQVGIPRSGGANAQVFGPSEPVLLKRAPGTFTVAYIEDNTNRATAIDFAGTLWQPPANISGEVTGYWKWPAIVAPSTGPTTLVVWLSSVGSQLRFSTYAGSTWAAAASITNALSDDSAALLALPAGEVLMTFRGTNGFLYSASFSGGAWGMPALVTGAGFLSGVQLVGSPALAKGQGGALAELAYVGTDGAAYHVRLSASRNWTTPVQVGTSVDFVSIASGP
jgi:hypothetical protein